MLLQSLVTDPIVSLRICESSGCSEIYHMALDSLKVFILCTISSALRSVFQTPIVLKKKTHYMAINMVVRVFMMLAAAAVLPGIWPTGSGKALRCLCWAYAHRSGFGHDCLKAYVTLRRR